MTSLSTPKQRLSALGIALASVAGFLSPAIHADVLNPVLGNVIYEEQFNDFKAEHWNTVVGNNCSQAAGCGFGNGELQSYQASNLTIEDVPGEPGNKAMVITAKRERVGDDQFTSGKFDSSDKLTVEYGLIEARIRIPKVEGGLWPAFWGLGNNRDSWPRKGEIDILEAGYPNDAHPQYPNSNSNNFVSANTFHYVAAACVEGNLSCAANRNWQPGPITSSSQRLGGAVVPSLSDRFAIYRLYWTPTQMRMTVSLDGVEHDMWRQIDISDAGSAAFRQPYFLIFNMAVGGSLTGPSRNRFTAGYQSAATNVTADFTGAKMYIDYIRVRTLDGHGTVRQGVGEVNPGYTDLDGPQTGVFGVFTDNTPVTRKLTLGTNLDFYVWENTFQVGTEPAYEGAGVISLSKNNVGWFGAAFNPRLNVDLSRFNETGSLKFKIKAPADLTFRIGVRDSYTNANSVEFPANTTRYGLVRDGRWGEVSIPVADLRGSLVAMQSLPSLFEITGATTASNRLPVEIAIDDVVYDCGSSPSCGAASSSAVSSVRSSAQPSSVASSVIRSSSSVASSVPRSSSAAVSSVVRSSSAAVSSAPRSSSVASSLVRSSAVVSSVPRSSSSVASSVVRSSNSSVVRSSVVSSSVRSSVSSAVNTPTGSYGHTVNSKDSVTFHFANAPWVDVHYTVNGQSPMNVRMLRNATTGMNSFTANNLAPGSNIEYSFTVGRTTGGAYEVRSSTFTLAAYGYSRPNPITNVQPTTVPVVFYTTDSTWSDLHYRVNNGPNLNVRMVRDANNTNTFSVQAPYGAIITYSFTIGRAQGGAMNTPTASMVNVGRQE